MSNSKNIDNQESGGAAEEGFLQEIVQLFVEPEVQRRAALGAVVTPIKLDRFQVLLWTDRSPEVRLNSEVELLVKAEGIDATALTLDERVEIPENASITAVRPDDLNAAHATFFQLGKRAHFLFDFTYNRDRERGDYRRLRYGPAEGVGLTKIAATRNSMSRD